MVPLAEETPGATRELAEHVALYLPHSPEDLLIRGYSLLLNKKA
jgi:hypothetical protein